MSPMSSISTSRMLPIIHRIGRTARIRKAGEALSLVMPEDGLSLQGIEQQLGVRLEHAKIGRFEALHHAADKPQAIARPPVAHHPTWGARGPNPGFPSRKTITG